MEILIPTRRTTEVSRQQQSLEDSETTGLLLRNVNQDAIIWVYSTKWVGGGPCYSNLIQVP